MGHQTTVIFDNDLVHTLEQNPEKFVKELKAAISAKQTYEAGDSHLSVHSGGGTVAQVVDQHHCDVYKVLAIGDHKVVELGYFNRCMIKWTDSADEIKTQIRESLGWRETGDPWD